MRENSFYMQKRVCDCGESGWKGAMCYCTMQRLGRESRERVVKENGANEEETTCMEVTKVQI